MNLAEVKNEIGYEPFFGAFTGSLKVYFLKDGRRIVFAEPVTIQKGRAYVLKYNLTTGQCLLLPVIAPVG